MHNIDFSNGRENIAFLGSRNDVWHGLGQEMEPGQPIKVWATKAGLAHKVTKVPAYAHLEGEDFANVDDHIRRVDGKSFLVRADTGLPLGYCSDRYQIVQPQEVLEWFERYISVDDRFQLDVAGSLLEGRIVWATAFFRDPLQVAGDRHTARLLMTTTYDGTGATINKATLTRVVCNNTLDMALADRKAAVRTRHNTAFNADRVSKELTQVVAGFDAYKKMGEAMAQVQLSQDQVKAFFDKMLDIKDGELSTRKTNQFAKLQAAYETTIAEGVKINSKWALLNAITRYVDHDRGTNDNKRALSSQFGSGAEMKRKAVKLLLAA